MIGTDAETDLAVLKIDASNLPSIAIADRTPLNVGDVVLAIGNPFGLNRTVTMGIVSALGRQLKMSTYEDFIQTDAAINQGNSGGALVNAYGELVGVNSDIFSPSGGNIGIGFAIPVSTAKAVLDQIVAHGRVIRGWIGAEYADPVSMQTPCAERGVCVVGIYDKGPAALAGLHPGDVLLMLDGEPIANQLELRNREASLAPGTKVELLPASATAARSSSMRSAAGKCLRGRQAVRLNWRGFRGMARALATNLSAGACISRRPVPVIPPWAR